MSIRAIFIIHLNFLKERASHRRNAPGMSKLQEYFQNRQKANNKYEYNVHNTTVSFGLEINIKFWNMSNPNGKVLLFIQILKVRIYAKNHKITKVKTHTINLYEDSKRISPISSQLGFLALSTPAQACRQQSNSFTKQSVNYGNSTILAWRVAGSGTPRTRSTQGGRMMAALADTKTEGDVGVFRYMIGTYRSYSGWVGAGGKFCARGMLIDHEQYVSWCNSWVGAVDRLIEQ